MENFKKGLIRFIKLRQEIKELEKTLTENATKLKISGIVKINDSYLEVKNYGIFSIDYKDLNNENI